MMMGGPAALGLEAAEWLLAIAEPCADGLAWGPSSGAPPTPDLYAGTAGVVLALVEAFQHEGDERWAEAAAAGGRALVRMSDEVENCSLYFGTVGIAFALLTLHRTVGDPGAAVAGHRLLEQVRAGVEGGRWGDAVDLLGGNAGIALGALACGNVPLAELAVDLFPGTSEPTAAGVTWQTRRGQPARRHHLSHGTLGVAHALLAVGAACGRSELFDLGLTGVADVVARDEAGPDGFLVPHSDPLQDGVRIERFSYGWCHGPAGDAQTFRLLERLTGQQVWRDLQERCWTTVTASGLPDSVRPGFWDNNGRCCGTAGVLALACDRIVAAGPTSVTAVEARRFADVLASDLARRATRDSSGARWHNREHREPVPELPAQTGWAMGNAGIVRELLRLDRIVESRDSAYAVDWPDHPPAG